MFVAKIGLRIRNPPLSFNFLFLEVPSQSQVSIKVSKEFIDCGKLGYVVISDRLKWMASYRIILELGFDLK